jgi:GH24 family phage-related lysozyme (muramidase)
MPEPYKDTRGKQGLATGSALAACIAAACLVAAPLATKWEGFSSKVYRDPANIATYCYGETENVDPSRIYGKDECAVLLRKRMARDYAPRIAACLPEIVGNRFIFGALIDASYNAGWAGVCSSPMAALIKVGQLAKACSALPGWYVTARYRGKWRPPEKMRAAGWHWTGTVWRKTFQGLVNRRGDEKAVCLRDLA